MSESKAIEDMNEHELAEALVAHPRWQYRPGMFCLVGQGAYARCKRLVEGDKGAGVPMLKDPATQGALLGLLFESMSHARGLDFDMEWNESGPIVTTWSGEQISYGVFLGRELLEHWSR